MNLLLVFIGGGLGACLRFFIQSSGVVSRGFLANMPVYINSISLVNILGSLIMGGLLCYFGHAYNMVAQNISSEPQSLNAYKLFLTTGFLGGFTTFSAFSADFLGFVQNGDYRSALLYVAITLVASFIAVALGFLLVKSCL